MKDARGNKPFLGSGDSKNDLQPIRALGPTCPKCGSALTIAERIEQFCETCEQHPKREAR